LKSRIGSKALGSSGKAISASTWITEQFREIHSADPELITRWHPILSHESFDGGQVPVSVHAGDRLDTVPLHLEGEEILCGHVALEDDLVPVCGVTGVQKSGVELPRPEEGARFFFLGAHAAHAV
jgi:hypothetical protein